MREVEGDLWAFHAAGHWVVITTNGTVRHDGACVMGRGIALQAKERFPDLPYALGDRLRQHGNRVFAFPRWRIFTFPVKDAWSDRASLPLIRASIEQLIVHADSRRLSEVYLVRPGTGNGRLAWKDVRPALASKLDDRFVVVEKST